MAGCALGVPIMTALVLRNGTDSLTFQAVPGGYRPEWWRLGTRPMLRFKDHEFLNVGALRVTVGEAREISEAALAFGGTVSLAGVPIDWTVRVSLPADGGPGFCVHTTLTPRTEAIELLEALSTFELPYEYDGTEEQMTVLGQQPVFRSVGNEELSGAGYKHPFWYYGHAGPAHLTIPTQAPYMCARVAAADGSNARYTTLIGNFSVCASKDLFAQASRPLRSDPADTPFPDPELHLAPGRRGRKFLVGAFNWNVSLAKDPNLLVEAGQTLRQEVLVAVAGEVPGGSWDSWMAEAWERMVRLHFPVDGQVPAWEVARARGASWPEAADWLAAQFGRPDGLPGLFNPARGPYVYSPHTRPKWDSGVEAFSGQWVGPLDYLGHLWADAGCRQAADRLETLFGATRELKSDNIGTIGLTPMVVGVLRKALLHGVRDEVQARITRYIDERADVMLNPVPGAKRGDGGILAWEAFTNLLAADLGESARRTAAARSLLDQANARLETRFESFNCAAEGDFVGAGQGRPFGHGIALSANILAFRRFGDPRYLAMARRYANIMLALYYAGYNNGESPDLDARGWAVGANGGRDQLCHMPPWETAYGLQQLAYLLTEEAGRPGIYDLLWLFAHTGLAMFPKARALKRLYTPGMGITYRPIESVATERAYYLTLPYLAYEEPWDQTMLASYQGVEPLLLAPFLGGGLVASDEDRVLALVPGVPTYDAAVATRFTATLWNPLDAPLTTRLCATVAIRRGERWRCHGPIAGTLTPEAPWTEPFTVPARTPVLVEFMANNDEH
jgi:hypothetical protein